MISGSGSLAFVSSPRGGGGVEQVGEERGAMFLFSEVADAAEVVSPRVLPRFSIDRRVHLGSSHFSSSRRPRLCS